MARDDPSPLVRLSLASALQRIAAAAALGDRRGPGRATARTPGDRDLPLMIWYGIEPLVAGRPAAPRRWRPRCRIPLVRRYLARRIVAADAAAGQAALVERLEPDERPGVPGATCSPASSMPCGAGRP